MSFPDAENAVVPNDKVILYLLNLQHPVGGSKAVWFASIGYTLENADEFAKDLIQLAQRAENFVSKSSPYGVKYEATGEMGCSQFRPGLVTTVWMVSENNSPRLITAYPAG